MKKRFIFVIASIIIVMVATVTLFAVNVSAAATSYDLWVAGTRVTSEKLSGSGWKYEPDTNTLTLNGFISDTNDLARFMQYDADNKVYYYAFIYVKDTNKKAMNLNIKLEGKESTIGDPYFSGHPAESISGKDAYDAFYGIYNPYGNVTITGSAKLNVYTNRRGISASRLTVDGCTGRIMMGAYTNCIDVQNLVVKGGSKINAYCGYGGGLMYNAPIHAFKSINIYDTSEVYAEIERKNDTDDYGVCGISCDQTINVYGGKLTGMSVVQGKTPKTSAPACAGIQTKVLNVSGGGVVEALVKQGSNKNYIKSTGICYYYAGNGTINVKGSGIIRAGVEKSNPDGSQYLLPDTMNVEDGVAGIYTAISKDGYEKYWEFTAYEREGIYLSKVGNGEYWSYYKNPMLALNYYSDVLNLNNLIVNGSNLNIYSVSGDHKLDPYVENGEIPSITVESGELMLLLTEGRTYNFTNPIEVKSGASLRIYGLGIINGLDVRGGGTVDFMAGTVTGKVQKSVNMIVEGGSINVDYDGQATDAKYVKVWRQEYILGNTGESFGAVTQVSVKNGRLYFRPGIYPIDGRKVYLWMQSPDELESLSVTPNGATSPVTLKGQPGKPLWLTLFQSIETHARTLYVSTRGSSVTIQPFTDAPTAEQMRGYKMTWSYSDDDMNWTTIDNPDCDSECRLTYTIPENESWINRTFRCELRDTATNQQLGVFTAVVHIFNPKLVCLRPFSENKLGTIGVTENTPPPNGLTADITRTKWYVDKGTGTFEELPNATGKEAYSITARENMDGWIYRCVARLSDGYEMTNEISADFKVSVIDRWVKITKQPESQTIKLPATPSISVTAQYAEKYQWQVSKRTYSGEDVPFEDIPGANGYKYTFGTNALDVSKAHYAYRCVVSNDYSEITTDEVTFTLLYDPNFDKWISSCTVVEGNSVLFEADIYPGNPIVATEICWKVLMDGSYIRISDIEELRDLCVEENFTKTTSDGITYHTKSTLRIDNPTVEMNGWTFRCEVMFGENSTVNRKYFDLTVRTECQQNGHDWLAATCTEPETCSRCKATRGETIPHTGGKATCITHAICEVCGNEYGNFDPATHPDDATDVWNVEDWNDDAGHESKWSCCGKPKYPYEYHKWEEGICTVCGCICEHPLRSEANCHERAWCHVCHIEYGQIDPNNHDLSLGTTTRDQKDPTCTEEGYTGDIVCWECLEVITYGNVIPAKGHSDSWPATCRESAYCSVCKQWFGDVDPDNHAEPWSAYYLKNETCHEEHWNCCDKVTTNPHDFDEEGVCRVCKYGCKNHHGGIATCMEPAICENCGEYYGDKDLDNHAFVYYSSNEDNTHTEICKCGKIISGPEMHKWESGTCTVCYTTHYDHTESDWIVESLPSFGTGGYRYKECTVCNMLLLGETLEALGFDTIAVRHNCAFGNDLSMMYAVLKSDLAGCTDICLIVEKEKYIGDTLVGSVSATLVPDEYTIDGKVYYRFDYRGVAAKEIGDTLTAKLEFVRDGIKYSGTVDTYSLKAYATELLSTSDNESFKTLLVDLLNYGAAAQSYFGYRTDALVNAGLSDEQRDLATKTYNVLTYNESGSDGTEYTASIAKKNILFGNRIQLLVATNFGKNSDLDGVSLRIRYINRLGQEEEKFVDGKDFVYREDVAGYTAYFDGLNASEFRTELELTLVKDGADISGTVRYGFDTYAKNRLEKSKDENFKALIEKTLIYSDSAKTYFYKSN